MPKFDFKVDLEKQRPLELALAKKLGAECTEGYVPFDLVFPDRTKAEVKTELGYKWKRGMNLYMEVCDVGKDMPYPGDIPDALTRPYVTHTGIVRAHKHRIDYWIHGFPKDEGFRYVWFHVEDLYQRFMSIVEESPSFTGMPLDNGKWVTFGKAIPVDKVLDLGFRVTTIQIDTGFSVE